MARTTQDRPRAPGWLAFLVLGLALASPATAEAAYPGANGRIALMVQQWRPTPPPEPPPPEYYLPGMALEPVPVSARIVSVSPKGQARRVLHTVPADRLSYYGGPVTRPAFSPNGKLIAFDEAGRIAIMRHDGTRLRVLPALSESGQTPTWSPSGRQLAFSGLRPSTALDPCLYCSSLFTVRPAGIGLRQVADYHAAWPAWSVKGRIAFLNDDDQTRMAIGPRDGLYSLRADGSRRRRLCCSLVALGSEPDWSPDGRRLAFRVGGRIFTMKADGSGRRPITEGPRRYSSPAWSPDGRYIAVIGRDEDDYGLYVMRPNGRGLRKVVDAQRAMSSDGALLEWEVLGPPSWQPLHGRASDALTASITHHAAHDP